MKQQEIEKAENLGAFLRVFTLDSLNEKELLKFYSDKTMVIRTGDEYLSPMDDLFEECTTPRTANAHLLLGHRGCGKSTELYHLKQRIEEAGQPVWLIDFELEMDVFNANCWDIMLAVTEGLCRIAEQKKMRGLDATLELVSDYLKADREVSKETDRSIGISAAAGAEAKTPSILKGVLNMFASYKAELKANTETREFVRRKMERRASDWVKYTNELASKIINKLKGKQPVLIFENVDRIQPPGKAMEIFHYHVLAQMPFPVIYTFPISLYYDSQFTSIRNFYKPHILPMIKVMNMDKSENEEGVKTIHEIVGLRANPALFDAAALKLLITQTGGVLQELFSCIISSSRRANRRGAERVEMVDAMSSLAELRSEKTRTISQPDYPKLANIYHDQKFREQIEDAEFLIKQMQALVVLEYNKKRWHDLHPVIAEFLKDQGFIHDPG